MTETGAGAVIIANREPRYVGTACIGVAAAGGAVPHRRRRRRRCRRRACRANSSCATRAREPRYGFFRRYLKDDAATQEAWSGGWFHTGDLVTRDAKGVMRFVDRRKNIIRRSGENISAVEVEAVLAQHPQVRAAAVTAVADELRGDEVFACIVPQGRDRGPCARSPRNFVALCRERLAYYQGPGLRRLLQRGAADAYREGAAQRTQGTRARTP